MNQELRIMNVLKIDTSNNVKTRIELNLTILDEERKSPSEQNVLELVEKALKKEKLSLDQVNSIEINTGPGSFTGLRVGSAIANALSFSGSIIINGKKIGEIITPEYS